MDAAMDEPSDERYEESKQHQAADSDCPAIGRADFALEAATAQKIQYSDTAAMCQQVEYKF